MKQVVLQMFSERRKSKQKVYESSKSTTSMNLHCFFFTSLLACYIVHAVNIYGEAASKKEAKVYVYTRHSHLRVLYTLVIALLRIVHHK